MNLSRSTIRLCSFTKLVCRFTKAFCNIAKPLCWFAKEFCSLKLVFIDKRPSLVIIEPFEQFLAQK